MIHDKAILPRLQMDLRDDIASVPMRKRSDLIAHFYVVLGIELVTKRIGAHPSSGQ